MKTPTPTPPVRTALSLAGLLGAALTLAGCMSSEEMRRANLAEDTGTCSDFGARYGSREHTRCMLQQQERRDGEQLIAMEKARISSETARNNLEMLELMRERRRRD
ncbi:hypothetical protein [Aureimonas sp. AU22]|uniref:hypothetical protein n=1 Tax=Aureimonas sp. AU22 TaxID=1638162 RepID=UPI000781FCAA|nr:hypothetical protein [Aureimonas sp. AU22]